MFKRRIKIYGFGRMKIQTLQMKDINNKQVVSFFLRKRYRMSYFKKCVTFAQALSHLIIAELLYMYKEKHVPRLLRKRYRKFFI